MTLPTREEIAEIIYSTHFMARSDAEALAEALLARLRPACRPENHPDDCDPNTNHADCIEAERSLKQERDALRADLERCQARMTPEERAKAVFAECTHGMAMGDPGGMCPDCVTLAIRAAIAEEREACAKEVGMRHVTNSSIQCMTNVCQCEKIAAAIRARS